MWIAPRALSCFPVFGKEGDRLGLWMRTENISTLYISSFPVSGNEVGQWRTQKQHYFAMFLYHKGDMCVCVCYYVLCV